jgi:ABC-2 type transport system permease protein
MAAMNKLLATLKKDLRVLLRDRLGLAFMFLMPVVLALLMTAVQNSTYDLVNNNIIPVLVMNDDTGSCGKNLLRHLNSSSMLRVTTVSSASGQDLQVEMRKQNAMVGVRIQKNFSNEVKTRANEVAALIMQTTTKTDKLPSQTNNILVCYHPVLQESFRGSVRGALRGALKITENEQLVKNLFQLLEHPQPDQVSKNIENASTGIEERTASLGNVHVAANATQHNIPAWTIFAMFFVVISMGGSLVREKTSGSFLRLKTMPVSFGLSIFSKQITFVFVTLLQAMIIFITGYLFFPMLSLPQLHMPASPSGLLLLTFLCGWCAVSFAFCMGVFAATQEQNNGLGAALVVMMAAFGGIIVPAFVLPPSLQHGMILSPMYWCLRSFYVLFLEHGQLKDIFISAIPILVIIAFLQAMAWIGLKQKRLI